MHNYVKQIVLIAVLVDRADPYTKNKEISEAIYHYSDGCY